MDRKLKIHMIGNTHYDPVWLWTWDEGMASIRSTFRAALDRMEENPGFIYSFSCPPVFEWIREVDPEMFERIRDKVREGRWQLVEGWWLQPDCSAAMGESYVRQGLYGQRYLQEHFGCRSKTAFNIDSFGHSAMLPQILAKSGIAFYVFGRPSPVEKELPGPLFRWESADGSAVLAYRCSDDGAGMYSQDVEKDILGAASNLDRFGHDLMVVYGVTNHGGAPTKQAISRINRQIEDKRKTYDVGFSTTEAFFSEQDASCLPIVREELMVNFFGPFSNHPEVKKNNRLGEYALLNAEKAALLRKWLQDRPYPMEKLTNAWKDLLFNQFHDILGGACIRNAYQDARNLHGRVLQTANEILHYGIQSLTREIDLSNTGYPGVAWNIVVWNLNAFDVEGPVEAEVQWAWEFDWYRGPIRITDAQGMDVPCQVIREYSVIPGFRERFVFQAAIPSLGYKSFLVHQEASRDVLSRTLVAKDDFMENERFKLEICRETGCIASLFDKKEGREILRNSAKPVVKQDDGDTWAFNVTGYGDTLGSFMLESAELIENGPVRAVIRTKGNYGNSHIEQDFILYRDLDIVDGTFKVNWREKRKVLKLEFNTHMDPPIVTASIPYGSVTRKNDGTELPMGEWMDVSSGDSGISILSDSSFAYDANGSTVGLTLLRSPAFGDLRIEPIDLDLDYDMLGQGISEGRWRMVIHGGNWKKAKIPQLAIAFNNPPIVIAEANHPGTRPPEDSFLTVEGDSTILITAKASEEGGNLVLRMYEYAGNEDAVHISTKWTGNDFDVRCGRYEIKTLCIDPTGNGKETDMLEE